MDVTSYPPPVDQLLTRGDPDALDPAAEAYAFGDEVPPWPDYLKLGIGPEHLPDLIRLATDPQFDDAPEDSPLAWAPLHAWRTIGQLGERAAAAAGPLVALSARLAKVEDDYAMAELPTVFGMLGPGANDALIACLSDIWQSLDARIAAAEGLAEIAEAHDDPADRAALALREQLGRYKSNEPDLNAMLVIFLANMYDVDSLPVMGRAYAAGRVDTLVAGEWEEVRDSLAGGKADDDADLINAEPLPPRSKLPAMFQPFGDLPLDPPGVAYTSGTTSNVPQRAADRAEKAKKDKKKQARKAKKQNRRK